MVNSAAEKELPIKGKPGFKVYGDWTELGVDKVAKMIVSEHCLNSHDCGGGIITSTDDSGGGGNGSGSVVVVVVVLVVVVMVGLLVVVVVAGDGGYAN